MSHCHTCLKTPTSPLVCSHCRLATYCGEACQGADWASHRDICWDRASADVDHVYDKLSEVYDELCCPYEATPARLAQAKRVDAVLDDLATYEDHEALKEAHAELAHYFDDVPPLAELSEAQVREGLARCVKTASKLHGALAHDPHHSLESLNALGDWIERSCDALLAGKSATELHPLWIGASRKLKRAKRRAKRAKRKAKKEKRRLRKAERKQRGKKRKEERKRERKERKRERKREKKEKRERKERDKNDGGDSSQTAEDRKIAKYKAQAKAAKREAKAYKAERRRLKSGAPPVPSRATKPKLEDFESSQLRMGLLLNARKAVGDELAHIRSLLSEDVLPREPALQYLIGGRVYRARMYARLLLPGGIKRVRKKFPKYRSEGEKGRQKLADIAQVARTLERRALRRNKAKWAAFAEEAEQALEEMSE